MHRQYPPVSTLQLGMTLGNVMLRLLDMLT